MKLFKTLATVFCLLALCVLVVPTATADDWNRETVVTFSGPVEVPGVGAQTLPAGTYVFKIFDSQSDRHPAPFARNLARGVGPRPPLTPALLGL